MVRMIGILGLLGAVALGSCVHQKDAAGFAWSYQDDPGEGPKLAYGAPATDNILLMMTCDPGSERVNLFLLGGSPRGLVLASAGGQADFGGEPVAAPGAGQMIEARAHLHAQPLRDFERTGSLTLIDRERSVTLDADRSERASVQRFFRACRT